MLLNRFGRRGGNGVEQDEDEDEEDDDFIDDDEMDEDGDWRYVALPCFSQSYMRY